MEMEIKRGTEKGKERVTSEWGEGRRQEMGEYM